MAVGWEQQSLPDAERDVGSSVSGVSSIQRKKDNQDQRLLEGWESVRRESKGITLTMIVRIGSLRSCRLSSETPIERSIAARGEMRWCAPAASSISSSSWQFMRFPSKRLVFQHRDTRDMRTRASSEHDYKEQSRPVRDPKSRRQSQKKSR